MQRKNCLGGEDDVALLAVMFFTWYKKEHSFFSISMRTIIFLFNFFSFIIFVND